MADVLELLDDRRFRLFGRANDLIHVAGRRSSLAHLNFHLNSIPGVGRRCLQSDGTRSAAWCSRWP